MKSLYDEHRFRLRARAYPRRRPLARACRLRLSSSRSALARWNGPLFGPLLWPFGIWQAELEIAPESLDALGTQLAQFGSQQQIFASASQLQASASLIAQSLLPARATGPQLLGDLSR